MATKDFSSKQEHMIADYLGWEVVSGSGARSFHPGDIKSERFLGECKTHVSQTDKIVFYKDVWDKIAKEAMSQMKMPILFVDDGTQKIVNTWCLFPARLVPLLSDRFYECQCEVLYPGLKINVNINLNIETARKVLKDYSMPGTLNYLTLTWGGRKFGLVPLDKFKALLDDISNM